MGHLGPISLRRCLKAESLSWLWSEDDVTREGWSDRWSTAGLEDAGRGHESGSAGDRWKLEKAWAQLFSSPPEGTLPCQHLDLGSDRPILDF